MKKLAGFLKIQSLELQVNLGWRDKELAQAQKILLDFFIWFPDQPKACLSDNLDDTLCYAKLIDEIRAQIGNKKYRLVEHLANDIHQIISTSLPEAAELEVKITKFPKIAGLTGGVSYSCLTERQDRI